MNSISRRNITLQRNGAVNQRPAQRSFKTQKTIESAFAWVSRKIAPTFPTHWITRFVEVEADLGRNVRNEKVTQALRWRGYTCTSVEHLDSISDRPLWKSARERRRQHWCQSSHGRVWYSTRGSKRNFLGNYV